MLYVCVVTCDGYHFQKVDNHCVHRDQQYDYGYTYKWWISAAYSKLFGFCQSKPK